MKVLVVDDSVLYRRAIIKALNEIPAVTEINEASNGKEAARKFEENPADLVTLDIEMPLMNGIDTIPHLLKANPKAYILMISSLTQKGATKTIDALNAGASDFLTKEHAFGLSEDHKNILVDEIKERINYLTPEKLNETKVSKVVKSTQTTTKVASKAVEIKPKSSDVQQSPVSIVLVGSSTGGPKALQNLLKPIDKNRNYAIVIVQHMPPIFTAQLADNLTRQTGHKVVEATEGMQVTKGDIVIAPGGVHLELKKSHTKWICALTEDPPVNSCRPSVDVTFMSVARQMRQKEVLGIMLTGMGEDGAQGCLKLYEQETIILTQDKNSCTVYGMPRAVDELNISTSSLAPIFLIKHAEKYMITPRDLSRGF